MQHQHRDPSDSHAREQGTILTSSGSLQHQGQRAPNWSTGLHGSTNNGILPKERVGV